MTIKPWTNASTDQLNAEYEAAINRLVPMVPLQIRISAAELKAIKLAALEADQTVSDFIVWCFRERAAIINR